jgi:hypothetical protein
MKRVHDPAKPKRAGSKPKLEASIISIVTADDSKYCPMSFNDHSLSMFTSHSATGEPLSATEQNVLREVIQVLQNLRHETTTTQTEVHSRLSTARNIIVFVDGCNFLNLLDYYEDQVFIVSELQNIAYHDTDHGGVQDIAQWCVRAWLQLLASRSEELPEVLSGEPDNVFFCAL